MHITPIINNQNKLNDEPSFKLWNRTVYKKDSKTLLNAVSHRNDTFFVRHIGSLKKSTDVESWIKFVEFLEEKYKNVSTINFYNYACSDGSEIYTFLVTLLSRFGKDFQSKFKEIYAIDIDKEAINKAKYGEYSLTQLEYNHIQELTQNKIHNYFDIISDEGSQSYIAKPKNNLKSKVKFIQADAFDDYKRIKPQNSVVFARNFWPYLEKKMPTLLGKFEGQLKENSTFTIGNFDKNVCPFYNFDIVIEIIKKGVRQTKIENVFEK